MIQIRTLGDVCVENEQGIIDGLVTRPKLLALLIYLVMEGEYDFHQRDTLLAVFWPDSDEGRARNNLRQSLHVLGRVLGPGAVIRRGRTLAGVDRSVVGCDALAFETALAEGRYADGLDVYRGTFLAGFYAKGASSFNAWTDEKSAHLHRLASQAARHCAEGAEEEEGRGHDAIREWTRVRSFDPVDENALARLVSILLEAGRRQEAAMHYRHFLRRLEELELPPSEEILHVMRSHFGNGAPKTED